MLILSKLLCFNYNCIIRSCIIYKIKQNIQNYDNISETLPQCHQELFSHSFGLVALR